MKQTDFEEIYRRNWQLIYGFARRRTLNPEDAADVVAETFAIAWRRRDALPHDNDQARMWLYVTARGVLANAQRGAARRERLGAALLAHVQEVAPDAAQTAESNSEVARITRAVRALTDSDRELIMLIAWDGLSPSEASQVLGVSAALTRVRLRRARIRLRNALNAGMQRTDAPGHVQVNGRPPVVVKEST